jgi:hypothetical protein
MQQRSLKGCRNDYRSHPLDLEGEQRKVATAHRVIVLEGICGRIESAWSALAMICHFSSCDSMQPRSLNQQTAEAIHSVWTVKWLRFIKSSSCHPNVLEGICGRIDSAWAALATVAHLITTMHHFENDHCEKTYKWRQHCFIPSTNFCYSIALTDTTE